MSLSPEMIATITVGVVIAIMGYLLKSRLERIEADGKEGTNRAIAYAQGQADRIDGAVQMLERDINAMGREIQKSREEMIGKYVHKDDLREALDSSFQPIREGIARMERNFEDLYRRLDSKADRETHRVGSD